MSDSNLPKPASPSDSTGDDANSQQMPPSARIPTVPTPVPPAGGKLPGMPSAPGVPGMAPAPVLKTPSMNPPGAPAGLTDVPNAKDDNKTGDSPIKNPPTASLGGANKPGGLPNMPGSPNTSNAPITPEKPGSSLGDKSSLSESPNTDNKKKAQPAKVKSSPLRFLPFILGGLILIGLVFFLFSRFFGNNSSVDTADTADTARKTVPAEQVTLTYWGLWEPSNAMESVFSKFEEANPGVNINYVKQSHLDYRERLQSAIDSGNGPDLFRFHASWTPMLSEELSPMPQSVMSASTYQATFYPVATELLSLQGQIFGVPLMYDGLALYYNTEVLQAANAQPPSTWAELKLLATNLTVKNGESIERGGLAIGNASNVEHFADILGLLMLQNGADLTDPTSAQARDALTFYTNFIKQDEVWSEDLPNSTVAFARGDAAMMFAPSWRAHEIQSLNPDLQFGIVPVPTLGDERLAWASFWAEGVSSKSKNATKAWQLISFMAQPENMQTLYSEQSKIRSFGEIYSRTDLADSLANDELVSPFLQDAPYATGWYMSSYTHDNGLNDLLIKYYQDAINAVLGNDASPEEALQTVSNGTQQVLRQYGVE